MAPRPSWQGYLKLSLVTCPVAMLPATSEAEKVRFHTLIGLHKSLGFARLGFSGPSGSNLAAGSTAC